MRAAGFLFARTVGRSDMANHLTPEELSKELGIERDEIIKVCLQESVPIYHGKIDKSLFLSVQTERAGVTASA
jgi:hypothetical protein